MDSRLILGGQTPDIMGNFGRGAQIGQQQNEFAHQNALRGALQQHGAGLVQGDQTSVNALAGFDPAMVMGVQNTQSQMQDREQRLQLAYQQANMQAKQFAATLSQQERAAYEQQLERGLSMGTQAQTPEQWDQIMQSVGAEDFVGQFESRDVLIAGALGLRDALKMNEAPQPMSPQGKLMADEQQGFVPQGTFEGSQAGGPGFRMASPEEAAQFGAAAGQFGPDNRFYPINPPTGMSIRQTPDGGFEFVQGAGVGAGGDGSARLQPGEGRVPDEASPTGTRIVAEPGGALERAAEERAAEQAAKLRLVEPAGQSLIRDAALAMDLIDQYGRWAVGVGSLTRGIPESPARRFAGHVESVKGNVAIDALLNIKASGAGLGAIPQAQLEALAALRGQLDPAGNPQEQRRLLQEISGQFAAIVEAEGGDPYALAVARGWNPETGRMDGGGQPRQAQQQPPTPDDQPPAGFPEDMRNLWPHMTPEERALFQ